MTITNSKAGRKPLGVYIHIPFCVRKCAYCDFLSHEIEDRQTHDAYVKSLVEEIQYRGQVYHNNYIVDTLFIGGGTPSLLDSGLIKKIIAAVRQSFDLQDDLEITIETNPGTLSEEKLRDYRETGINRISIGAQSFNDKMLESLGRIHCAGDILKTYQMVRKVGFSNVNLDLMFAIPEHTMQIWRDTVKKALSLCPEHLSFYSLQLEENTPLFDQFQNETLHQIPDELDREMYEYAVRLLQDEKYIPYEISSAAKSGCECKHNMKYWSMEAYLGVGLGAHSFVEGTRTSNNKDLKTYVCSRPEEMTDWVYMSSERDMISEFMFTGLRKRKGISLIEFENRFKKSIQEVYRKEWPIIEANISKGLLILDEKTLSLSLKGVSVSNAILSEFMI